MTDKNRGLYIVIDGAEGAGKTTQIELVASLLRDEGRIVRISREPDSQTDVTARSIRTITQNPQYPMNTRTEVLLYNAARSQSLENIKKSVEQGIDCLVDRSFLTTLANQYYGRNDGLDYRQIDEIIRFSIGSTTPDVLVVLDAPPEELVRRLVERGGGERFDNLDAGFLGRVVDGFRKEAQLRAIPLINAVRPAEDIAQEIMTHIGYARSSTARASYQAAQPAAPAKFTSVNNKIAPSENSKKQLADWVTNTGDKVYVLKPELDSLTAAAAMARLSRSANDLRDTLLLEFSGDEAKDEQVIKRIITQYGDDSVQQLLGIHVVVEQASNLLTKQLEWGRLAAYLEQSTRYIYYDQRVDGRYRYIRPSSLGPKLIKAYETILDKIFDNYSTVVRGISNHLENNSATPKAEQDAAWRSSIRAQACDAARGMLPVATQSTVGIFASGQALENLIMRLRASELAEAREVASKILSEVRKVVPAFFERADQPGKGGAYSNYLFENRRRLSNLAEKLLPTAPLATPQPGPTLTDYYPKNEFDLLPHMLYAVTDQSETDLSEQTAALAYDDKLKIFSSYLGNRLNRRHKPGRALERASYSWDIISDYGSFRDLQRHRLVSDLAWQELTPRFGYDMPALVEECGLSELYEQAFDLSLELHSLLIAADKSQEAQYATLFGHRMRWKLTMNAREAYHFLELRTSPQGHPAYRKLAKQMYDQLIEVHPLIAGGMKFINLDEDPELTRLAAERYSQSKLQNLDKK